MFIDWMNQPDPWPNMTRHIWESEIHTRAKGCSYAPQSVSVLFLCNSVCGVWCVCARPSIICPFPSLFLSLPLSRFYFKCVCKHLIHLMSQVKASPPPQTQSPFSISHTNQDLHSTHRIMTRRASRSAQSSSTPSTKHDTIQENDITDSEPIGRMTTRSRSTDVNTQTSSSAEESSSTNNTLTPSSNATNRRHVRTKRVTKPSPSSSSSSPTNTSMRRRRAAANKDSKPSGMMNAIKQQR